MTHLELLSKFRNLNEDAFISIPVALTSIPSEKNKRTKTIYTQALVSKDRSIFCLSETKRDLQRRNAIPQSGWQIETTEGLFSCGTIATTDTRPIHLVIDAIKVA